jgi:MoaA/NifB/PqqE/SkfB family radical SAM enzyme
MKPILLHYYITNRCNAQCVFCDIWKESPKVDADPDQVIPNLKDARKAGCTFVDFTGGEPLLNPHLPVFLSEAKRLGYTTSVTTNAILFKEMAAQLAGLIDLLHFSIDADTQELHDEIRGCRSFDKVIEAVPAARANNLVPDLLFTYTAKNIDAFDGIYDFARENRLVVILDPVFTIDGKDQLDFMVHRKATGYAKRPGVYLNKAHLRLRAAGGNSTDRPLCKAVSSTIVILANNRLALPCYHHTFESIPIAPSLTAVLNGDRRKEALLLEGTYPFCEGCHINCYFDPTFTHSMNRYFFSSLQAKTRYCYYKYLMYKSRLPVKLFTSKRYRKV